MKTFKSQNINCNYETLRLEHFQGVEENEHIKLPIILQKLGFIVNLSSGSLSTIVQQCHPCLKKYQEILTNNTNSVRYKHISFWRQILIK